MTNLVENHRCSFHLNSDSHGLDVVSIEGTVHLPPDGSPWNEVPGFVEKYAGEFAAVWNLDMDETAAQFAQQIVITPAPGPDLVTAQSSGVWTPPRMSSTKVWSLIGGRM